MTVLAILALGLLIIVHEGGHYFVAKWSGMRVERFSLGFGPAILKWRHKGTQFQLAPIPLGGFVQIVGMNPHEEYDDKDPSVYPNRPTLLRFLTIFAGPFTNVLFSVVLIFCVFVGPGVETPSGRNVVDEVLKGEPAVGLLEPGDIVTQVDGQPAGFVDGGFRSRIQQAQGKPVLVTVLRKGVEQTITIAPHADSEGAFVIGIRLKPEFQTRETLPLGRAVYESFRYPIVKSKQILGGLWDIVAHKAPLDAVGGVGITRIMSKEFSLGWGPALELLAMLNVYLGLFNLLPLPALDGGRLVFLAYELATRRRPNPKVEAAVHMAGFVVLLILMILVTFKDIKNLFT